MDSVDKNTGGNGAIQFQSKNINTQKSSVFDSKDKKQPFYKKHKKLLIILGCVLIAVIIGIIILFTVFIPMWKSMSDDKFWEVQQQTESEDNIDYMENTNVSVDTNSISYQKVLVEAEEIYNKSGSDAAEKYLNEKANEYEVQNNFEGMLTAAFYARDFWVAKEDYTRALNILVSIDPVDFSGKSKYSLYAAIADLYDRIGEEELKAKYENLAEQVPIEERGIAG